MNKDLSSEEQQHLIEGFKCDKNVFEQIYNYYYEMIFRYLAKRTVSAEVAYDLTSDTFIKAFESFGKFQWKGISIKVWLYRIAINSLKNYRRNPKLAPLSDELAMVHPDLITDVKDELAEVDKALFGDQDLAKLSDAIATLKPKYQNIVSLYYFDGLSHQEIGEIVNRSPGAVKVMMHRAIKSLKQILIPNPA